MAVRVIEVNKNIYDADMALADEIRAELAMQKTLLINLMASPGAGKTTLLLETIKQLKGVLEIGVMEADIESEIDAKIMEEANVKTIQVHTGGECAMNVGMTKQALDSFETKDLDVLFLENVGNLVCPAEEDVGAHKRVAILSVPEGDDKPLKYPLMFEVVDAVIISKIDTLGFFDFDKKALEERVGALNPKAKIFYVCAKTGEGIAEWCEWVNKQFKDITTESSY